MSQIVFVHWLPTMFAPEDLRGGVAVVIDLLRASTTITQALFAGAKAVIPCGEVAEGEEQAVNLPPGSYLLGGERGGIKIPGFDLGNSPTEYTPERVADRTIVFTTTNGTRALKRCQEADQILIGCFANLDAVAKAVGKTGRPVHLVCAGTDGKLSAEDVLCAGAMVADLLVRRGRKIVTGSDANRMAFELYNSRSHDEDSLLEAVRESAGGRNLMELGYDSDIVWASKRNRFNIVPQYHRESGRIEIR